MTPDKPTLGATHLATESRMLCTDHADDRPRRLHVICPVPIMSCAWPSRNRDACSAHQILAKFESLDDRLSGMGLTASPVPQATMSLRTAAGSSLVDMNTGPSWRVHRDACTV